jgi:hypothetical protein
VKAVHLLVNEPGGRSCTSTFLSPQTAFGRQCQCDRGLPPPRSACGSWLSCKLIAVDGRRLSFRMEARADRQRSFRGRRPRTIVRGPRPGNASSPTSAVARNFTKSVDPATGETNRRDHVFSGVQLLCRRENNRHPCAQVGSGELTTRLRWDYNSFRFSESTSLRLFLQYQR